jgi:hypothetical protein
MGSKAAVMTSIKPAALTAAKWIGTGAGVSGAIMIALNLGLVIYGFGLFLISSLLWSAVGWVQRETREYFAMVSNGKMSCMLPCICGHFTQARTYS